MPTWIMRVAAGTASLALTWPVTVGLTMTLLFAGLSAARPDPGAPEADPCCGPPATWEHVAMGSVAALALAAGTGLVSCALFMLARFATTGRGATWPSFAWTTGAAVGVTAAGLGAGLALG